MNSLEILKSLNCLTTFFELGETKYQSLLVEIWSPILFFNQFNSIQIWRNLQFQCLNNGITAKKNINIYIFELIDFWVIFKVFFIFTEIKSIDLLLFCNKTWICWVESYYKDLILRNKTFFIDDFQKKIQ